MKTLTESKTHKKLFCELSICPGKVLNKTQKKEWANYWGNPY